MGRRQRFDPVHHRADRGRWRTYAAMEFTGEAIDNLPMDGRFTMANMAIEAGGKAGIFHVDEKTLDYIKPRAKRPYKVYEQDADAEYAKVIEWDVSKMEPQVSLPHLPSNTKPVSQVGKIEIDQSVIGSCTNGRISDLRIAAEILKGKKVHPRVRTIVIPGHAADLSGRDARRSGGNLH